MTATDCYDSSSFQSLAMYLLYATLIVVTNASSALAVYLL